MLKSLLILIRIEAEIFNNRRLKSINRTWFKLFSVITFAHALVSGPLWSAYTDAYHRGDFVWIEVSLRHAPTAAMGRQRDVCSRTPPLWFGGWAPAKPS